MKTAIIIAGNLRTFMMPTREDSNIRICDLFVENILNNNNLDIFVYTDTNDFYHDGVQYYSNNNKIEILNNDSFRIYNKIDFIENNKAKDIIEKELLLLFGNKLKKIFIESPFDVKNDINFHKLTSYNVKGSSPTLLIHQFRKLKLAYKSCTEYELENNINYDIIVKWRFDISINGKLDFTKYNYVNNDVYIAGDHSPIIYDWHAFGNKKAMNLCLSLYDNLGAYINEGRIYLCNTCHYYSNNNYCSNNDHKSLSEITLSPEYHLFKIFKLNGIKINNSGYSGHPYRYQDNNVKNTVDEIIKNLNINASVTSYTAGNDANEYIYNKK